MLRVGVDARCLNRPFVRGMGRYLKNVVEIASERSGLEWEFYSDRPDLPFHAPDCPLQTVNCFEMRGYRFNTWEQMGLPWAAKRAGVDVLHCSGTTLPWWQPVPTVVTVHDVIPWMEHWQEAKPNWYWRRLVPAALRRCAAIITISQSAANDIGERWPRLSEKLHVIPHGIEDIFPNTKPRSLDEELQAMGVREPYFLYIGGGTPRKRFSWARRVMESIADSGVQLVACGLEDAAREELRKDPQSHGRIVACKYLSDSQMARLYQNAVSVLFPSLYEGFGFPVLEAQAVGTPVVFSALGSLAELVGPGACVLPPDDLLAWVDTCRRLLAERRNVRTQNDAARAWAVRFSWSESAAKHLEVYEAAARPRGQRSRSTSPRSAVIPTANMPAGDQV